MAREIGRKLLETNGIEKRVIHLCGIWPETEEGENESTQSNWNPTVEFEAAMSRDFDDPLKVSAMESFPGVLVQRQHEMKVGEKHISLKR